MCKIKSYPILLILWLFLLAVPSQHLFGQAQFYNDSKNRMPFSCVDSLLLDSSLIMTDTSIRFSKYSLLIIKEVTKYIEENYSYLTIEYRIANLDKCTSSSRAIAHYQTHSGKWFVIFNKKGITDLYPMQIAFILCHEISHNLYRHPEFKYPSMLPMKYKDEPKQIETDADIFAGFIMGHISVFHRIGITYTNRNFKFWMNTLYGKKTEATNSHGSTKNRIASIRMGFTKGTENYKKLNSKK